MKANRIFTQTIIVVIATLALAGVVFCQNLNLNGAGGTLTGTYNVKGNISTSSATGVYTFSGTMNLNGTGTTLAQTIASGGSATATKALVFANLNAGTGQATPKTIVQGGIITVNTAFVENLVGPGSFTVGANTLSFGGTTTRTVGTFDASNASSIVNYTSGSAQTVLASTYGGTLGLSNAGAKSIGAGGVTAATMTHAGGSGALTVGNALTVTGGATALDNVSVSNTLTYNGSNTLSIATLSANSGTITTGAGTGTLSFLQTGALTYTGGTITTGAGTLSFAGPLSVSTGSSLTVTGAGTAQFSGNVTTTGATAFTFATNSTAIYNVGATTIAGVTSGSYYNLTLQGGDTKSASGNLSIGGALAINTTTTLDMGTTNFTLAATGGYAGVASGATVRFGGTTHGTAIANGTVEYYGNNIAQSIAAGSYNHLLLTSATGSSTKTIADGTTVNTTGDLDVNTNVTLAVGTSLTTAILNVGTTNVGSLNVVGSITNLGTITVGN